MARGVQGTQLSRGFSTSAYTAVYEVTDLSIGALTRERIDVTNFSTTSDQRSYIGGFIELGEVTFTVNYDASNATHSGSSGGLAGLVVNGTTMFWKVVPGGTTADPITFKGYVSNFAPTFTVGSQQTADVSVQLTTLPAYST